MNIKHLGGYDREERFKNSKIPAFLRTAFLLGTPALATLIFYREDVYRIAEKMMENNIRTRVEQSAMTRNVDTQDPASSSVINNNSYTYNTINNDSHDTINNYYYRYPTDETTTTEEEKKVDYSKLGWFDSAKMWLFGYDHLKETKTVSIKRTINASQQLTGENDVASKEIKSSEKSESKKSEKETEEKSKSGTVVIAPKPEAGSGFIRLEKIEGGYSGLVDKLKKTYELGYQNREINIVITKQQYQKYIELLVLNKKDLFLGASADANHGLDGEFNAHRNQLIDQIKNIVKFYKEVGEFSTIAENLQTITNVENNESMDLLLLLGDGYYEQGNAWGKAIPTYERFLFAAEQQSTSGKSFMQKTRNAFVSESDENLLVRLQVAYRLARCLEQENQFEKATGVIDYHLEAWHKISSLKNVFGTAAQKPINQKSNIVERIEDQQLRLSALKQQITYRQGLNQGFKLWGLIHVKSELFAILTNLISAFVGLSAFLALVRKVLSRENESKNVANALEQRFRAGAKQLRAYLNSERSESEKNKLHEALLSGDLNYYQFSKLSDIRHLTVKDVFDLLHTDDERILNLDEFLYLFKNSDLKNLMKNIWELLNKQKTYIDIFKTDDPSAKNYSEEVLKYFVCKYLVLQTPALAAEDVYLFDSIQDEHKATLKFLKDLHREPNFKQRAVMILESPRRGVDENFTHAYHQLFIPTVASINETFVVKESLLDKVIAFFKK